jgi:hypothetical protein
MQATVTELFPRLSGLEDWCLRFMTDEIDIMLLYELDSHASYQKMTPLHCLGYSAGKPGHTCQVRENGRMDET